MLIKYQALTATLKKKSYALYVLIGNDPYLLNDAAYQIKQTMLSQHECTHTVLDIQAPSDWSQLVGEANSYSLFSETVILDARFDKKTIDATGKNLLIDYLKDVNTQCIVLLRMPQVSAKSLTWLVDSPHTLVVQNYPLASAALKQWIEAQSQSRQLPIDPQAVLLIQQYTQGNMLATAQLLDKLSLCYPIGAPISVSMIREQLSDQSHFELHELAEACLSGNAYQSIRLLHHFSLEKIEPNLILWLITQEIRLLIQIHYLLQQSKTMDAACQQLKIWSSRVGLYTKAHARLSLASLLQLMNECKQLDGALKSSQNAMVWDTLDRMALTLCGVKQ
jgi:DNA polymerase-3 subunit delta